MVTFNGINYYTKDEAAALCRAFAAAHAGTEFHNHAHHKRVDRPRTAAECEAIKAKHNQTWCYLEETLLSFDKLYTDSAAIKANRELKGLWIQTTGAAEGGR